jgi:hypothetical protein
MGTTILPAIIIIIIIATTCTTTHNFWNINDKNDKGTAVTRSAKSAL